MSDLKTRLKNGPVAMPGYDYYGHPDRVYAMDEADDLLAEAADRIEELEVQLGQFTDPIAKQLIDAALFKIVRDLMEGAK